jgi:hypothetical protein
MKCKKIFINILESKDTIQEINDVIEKGDLQGYHIILENKTPDKFSCEFLVNSQLDIFWSIDMKKTIRTAQNIGVKEYKCKVELEKKEKKELIIWANESIGMMLKKIENHVLSAYIGDINSIYLPASGNAVDIHFFQLFGFHKKYHFDQYRFLLIINLCNHAGEEADNDFVRESVEKIIGNSKEERKIEEDTKAFYKLVLQNILSENIGAYDTHKIYRSQILNRLSIDCEKDYQRRIEKKVQNQPFQRNEILRTVANKTVQNDGFIVTEWNRKERFLIPQNTVIISQTKNWNIGEIERTLEKLVKSSPNHTYEIIIYADHPSYIKGLEKIVENLFYNFDRLFKVKTVLGGGGGGGKWILSEMQKLLVMTNFINSIAPYFFVMAANSCFPANYMNYIEANYKEGDRMIVSRSANAIHLKTGHTQFYEANTNKLYEYYIECVFPVMEKNLFERINYRILGDMNKIKDLKNFLMKNGTINGLRIVEYFDKNALHVFDS